MERQRFFNEETPKPKCPNQDCRAGAEHHIEDPERGDVICGQCGFIVGEYLSLEREWGEYDSSKHDTKDTHEQVRASTFSSKFDFLGTDQGRHWARTKEYRYLLKNSELSAVEREVMKKRKVELSQSIAPENDPTRRLDSTATGGTDSTQPLQKTFAQTSAHNEDPSQPVIDELASAGAYTSFQTRTGFKRFSAQLDMYQAANELGASLTLQRPLVETAHFLLKHWSKSQSVINLDLWKSRELILAAFLKASRVHNGAALTLKAFKTQFPDLDVRRLESFWSFFSYQVPDRTVEQQAGKKFKKIAETISQLAEKILCDFLPSGTKNTDFYRLVKKARAVVDNIASRFENRKPSTVAAITVILLLNAELIQFDHIRLCEVANVDPIYMRRLTAHIFVK